MLKAGILFADKVNTVSPTYAREICESHLGEGLASTLRSRGDDLWGILNGIDTDVWDPAADPAIPARYSSSRLANKAKVKRALIEELGLDPIGRGKSVPVIGMVGRLTPQKGIDLLEPVLEELMEEDIRLVVLGTGDEHYEEFLKEAAESYEGKMCALIGFDAELSHRIYAGSDLFLMPSQFEPCGISQMIAMRYGTLPIVRETGGLRDTVIPYNEETGEGTGFSFANYDAEEMLEMVKYAVSAWRHKSVRDKLVHQAMKADFSFERCARTYALLYRELA
jgi:starch synthase